MARGDMKEGDAEKTEPKSGVKIELVELQPGKNYELACPNGVFGFVAEAGGIISGDAINGGVQDGKVIFTAGEDEYEGYFISQTTIEATHKDKQGQSTQCQIQMKMK